jgi:c-di-GMP-binding flagellar brake protein YcgR
MQNEEQLRAGETFLLRAGKEYSLSTIESVTAESLEVSVPAKDFPTPGMKVSMDFHDDDGCTVYKTEVIRGPAEQRRSVRLKRPIAPRRITHRQYTRVETALPIRFREIGTVTYHQGTVVNLSAGGVLLKTTVSHEFQKTLEMELGLPGNTPLNMLGQIVHKAEQLNGPDGRMSLYGCKFIRLDRRERKAITQYVREQLGHEMSLP